MAIQTQIRRGTANDNADFVGAKGELVYITDEKRLVVHDGENKGGTELARTKEDKDIEFTNETKGIILIDRKDTSKKYRLYIEDGNLGIEEV